MDPKMQAAMSILRSVLIGLGAFAAGKGWLSDDAAQQLINAILILAPAIWGAVEKVKQ